MTPASSKGTVPTTALPSQWASFTTLPAFPTNLCTQATLQASPSNDPAMTTETTNGHSGTVATVVSSSSTPSTKNGCSFIVWHPMTDDRRLVKVPLDIWEEWSNNNSNIALLSTDDNNRDAEFQATSSFRLAIVSTNSRGQASAGIFSSLTGDWRKPRSADLPSMCHIRVEPCAIVGNTMYQPLYDYRVMAYDVNSQTLATFDRPRGGNIRLMKADGGTNLGLAAAKGLNLHLWVRDTPAAVWLPRSTIDLGGLSRAPLPHTDSRFVVMPPVKIIGVAEEGDALFLWTMVGIFMICPKSMVFRKVHEVAENLEIVYPYAAF